jgi:hypothetical protein
LLPINQFIVFPILIHFHGIKRSSLTSNFCFRTPARRPLAALRVRAGFLSCCAMTGPPPTDASDTEAVDRDAAAAAAALPFDPSASAILTELQQQEIAARLAKEKASAAAKERQEAYDAALARLAQAEEEAANASKARDAAITRADRERALAATALQPSTPEESSTGGSASPAGGPADLHSTLLLQEAAALLNLHAQAVAVNNIRSLVHIVLDVDSNNFNRWRDQFLLVLDKFSLQAHVLLAAPVPSPDWDRMDYVVKSWILDSLTDDLAEIVSSQGATARDAWLAIESQFLGNRETRAIQLETKFRNFVQGDLSITEYCRRLKKMADDLTALGEVVTDHTLVLNVIRGLNERFTHIGALLRRAHPFPTFLEVKDDLSLEELTLGSRQPSPAAALAATTKSAPSSGAGNGAGSKPNRRSKRDGGSEAAATPRSSSPAAAAAAGRGAKTVSLPSGGWPTVYNPWTGTIQLWSGARHPPLAPIPRPPQQQAFIVQHQQLHQPQQLFQPQL